MQKASSEIHRKGENQIVQIEPEHHSEAITSKPLLLHAVGEGKSFLMEMLKMKLKFLKNLFRMMLGKLPVEKLEKEASKPIGKGLK